MSERPRPLAAPLRGVNLPNPLGRRAVVVGAGSFGTAVAVLLARGGFRTTLQTRTAEQAEQLRAAGENERYLAGVPLPPNLRIEPIDAGPGKAEFVFLGVPSAQLGDVVDRLEREGLDKRTKVVSLSKGLVPPLGVPPTVLLAERFGTQRVACVGGPAHAREMVTQGAGLVASSADEELAATIAAVFLRAGVVCEHTDDPVGVELAGAAKNAAALAAGATEGQGLNAAGAAAGHIFIEVWRLAERLGAQPATFIGLAGTGDLVATALAPQSRNRRAGELLAAGVPTGEIPARIGQAVEAFESVPLLASALERHGISAPVTTGLVRLIGGTLPLDDWVALVRTTVPPPASWRGSADGREPGPLRRWWRRLLERIGLRRPAELERGASGPALDGGAPGPTPVADVDGEAVPEPPALEPGAARSAAGDG
ncbi:NAD(P)H-dependent glycerol-3-phosphate dehydrogenase [Patulibacter defluvii]|uniref:NAD(P)H-dependent glycerol-3-phosphate dehydrogenase n=1 Tax=Patulibacter defluvii TaxID=3095358 RepID=UPI002A74BED3|nr:NAD(P)H-dependent glycerol-3-phosphate dehydrogenase [Patulibacter sp. DM4]